MEITSAMEAFLEQERRAITENIRRTGVHLTYVAVAAAEGDEPACACCRALGTGPEEAEDAHDGVRDLFVAAGGDPALLPPRVGVPFCYTTGLFGAGHAELVVLGLPPREASAVLNGAAQRVLERGSDLAPGEQLDVAGRTVRVEELPMSGMVLLAAHDYYDRPPWEPIPASQLTWADAAGRFPEDEGHDPGRWRQPPASGWRA